MGQPARNFLNICQPLNKRRDVAHWLFEIAYAQLSIRVTPHRVDISTVAGDEARVLFTAAHTVYDYIEAAYFRQVVDYFLTADSQLSIVVV